MKRRMKYILPLIVLIVEIACKKSEIVWLPFDYSTIKADTTILIPTTSYRLSIYHIEKEITLKKLKGYPHFNDLGRKELLFWSNIDSLDFNKKDSIILFISGYLGDSLINTKEAFLVSGYYSHTSISGNENYMEFTEMMIYSNILKKLFYIKWEF